MKSRMEKYYDSNGENLRTKKNEDIYKKVHDSEINNFDINSNVSVIGDSSKNIDVENLRQILDKKYRETPQRRSINLEISENNNINQEEIKDEEKEYDINVILEKAKKQKQPDYQEERLKKIRNTQFDILKDLNLENKEVEEEKDEEKELMTLINTIASNELLNDKSNSSDPLDMFDDLKGNEDTKILPIDEIKTMEIKSKDEIKEIGKKEVLEKEEKKEKTEEKEEVKKLENSFFTNSIKLKKKDFEDFSDLQDEYKKSTFKTILTIIIVIAFIIGLLFLVNKIFDLNIIEKLTKLIK